MKFDIEEWWNSEDCEKFCEYLNKKYRLKEVRHKRFEKWLENNDFDVLMNRLIQEHDNNYIDKCYHKGHTPNTNRKLSFVIGYIVDNFSPIKVNKLNCDFPNQIWQFRNYYFQHIHGQGTITRIYKKDNNELILQL